MFQEINEKKKNEDRDENKIHVSRDKNKKSFNCDDFFVRFNFEKHYNLNKKKHETKSEQIVEKTLFQRIRNALLKMKKQHELIREKKTFWRLFKKQNIDEKSK